MQRGHDLMRAGLADMVEREPDHPARTSAKPAA